MSVLIVCLIAVGAILVGVKVYFQEKDKESQAQPAAPAVAEEPVVAQPEEEKSNEDIVAERLAEISKFENEVAQSEEAPAKKAKRKYYYKKPKKQQPKIKAK